MAELRRRRRHREARSAQRDLPEQVDTEQDQGHLALLGIDPDLSDTEHIALLGD